MHESTSLDVASPAQVFAFGMMCALISSSVWLTLATYLELAVSTTHTISEWQGVGLTSSCCAPSRVIVIVIVVTRVPVPCYRYRYRGYTCPCPCPCELATLHGGGKRLAISRVWINGSVMYWCAGLHLAQPHHRYSHLLHFSAMVFWVSTQWGP
jgi:hypothetical protein